MARRSPHLISLTFPVVAGDSESALAGWLRSDGSPILVPFDKSGGSFDLFDPHWGASYMSMIIRPTGTPSHYFVGLLKPSRSGYTLVIGETGQTGSFLTELNAMNAIADVWYQSLDFVSVAGHPVAIWERDNRVYAGEPAGRQHLVRAR